MIADERTISRLRWSARRGLLENDLIMERFFNRYAASLTIDQVFSLDQLLDLTDNDLLDLFLSRKEPEGPLHNSGVIEILAKLREL
jgi:antitoxin CptB